MAAPLVTDNDAKRAAIGHVVAVVGSLSRTASHFGVSVADLKAWLQGNSDVPNTAFLTSVDFLLKTPTILFMLDIAINR